MVAGEEGEDVQGRPHLWPQTCVLHIEVSWGSREISLRPAYLPCCQRSRPVDLPPAIGEERPPLGLQHGCCEQRWRSVGKPGRSTPPSPRSRIGTSVCLLASRSTFLASHPPEGVPQVVSLAERGEGALFLGSLNTQPSSFSVSRTTLDLPFQQRGLGFLNFELRTFEFRSSCLAVSPSLAPPMWCQPHVQPQSLKTQCAQTLPHSPHLRITV